MKAFIYFLVALLLASTTTAALENNFTISGFFINESTGLPLNGTHTATFSAYPALSGGSAALNETMSLDFFQGVYHAVIADNFTSLEINRTYFWTVTVAGGTETSPRIIETPARVSHWAENSTHSGTASTITGTITTSQISDYSAFGDDGLNQNDTTLLNNASQLRDNVTVLFVNVSSNTDGVAELTTNLSGVNSSLSTLIATNVADIATNTASITAAISNFISMIAGNITVEAANTDDKIDQNVSAIDTDIQNLTDHTNDVNTSLSTRIDGVSVSANITGNSTGLNLADLILPSECDEGEAVKISSGVAACSADLQGSGSGDSCLIFANNLLYVNSSACTAAGVNLTGLSLIHSINGTNLNLTGTVCLDQSCQTAIWNSTVPFDTTLEVNISQNTLRAQAVNDSLVNANVQNGTLTFSSGVFGLIITPVIDFLGGSITNIPTYLGENFQQNQTDQISILYAENADQNGSIQNATTGIAWLNSTRNGTSTSDEINTFTADTGGATTGVAVTLAGGENTTTTRSGDTVTIDVVPAQVDAGAVEGVLADANLPAEVPLTDEVNSFTENQTFVGNATVHERLVFTNGSVYSDLEFNGTDWCYGGCAT